MKPNLKELKDAFEALIAEEKEIRSEINHMRRKLSEKSKEARAAYAAWRDESDRLVG